MSGLTGFPKIILDKEFGEDHVYMAPFRGLLRPEAIELEDGQRFSVFFVEMARVQQELAESVKQGEPYFTEPGLVILPEVTVESVQSVLPQLLRDGFFSHLKPIDTTI